MRVRVRVRVNVKVKIRVMNRVGRRGGEGYLSTDRVDYEFDSLYTLLHEHGGTGSTVSIPSLITGKTKTMTMTMTMTNRQ